MNIEQLKEQANSGLMIRFKARFCEDIAKDVGLNIKSTMAANVLSASEHPSGEGYDFVFDFTAFKNQNKQFRTKLKQETIFLAKNLDFHDHFEVMDHRQQALYKKYLEDQPLDSYLEWLEAELIDYKLR